LISLHEKRKSLGLKSKSQKTFEKIEQMLSDLKINQANSSKVISPINQQFFDSTSSSHDSIDSDIRDFEKNLEKLTWNQNSKGFMINPNL
jgi:hypothetical protein